MRDQEQKVANDQQQPEHAGFPESLTGKISKMRITALADTLAKRAHDNIQAHHLTMRLPLHELIGQIKKTFSVMQRNIDRKP